MTSIEHGKDSGVGSMVESASGNFRDSEETVRTELIVRRKNLEAKKLMAAELLSMGFGVDAIARILHLKLKNTGR